MLLFIPFVEIIFQAISRCDEDTPDDWRCPGRHVFGKGSAVKNEVARPAIQHSESLDEIGFTRRAIGSQLSVTVVGEQLIVVYFVCSDLLSPF